MVLALVLDTSSDLHLRGRAVCFSGTLVSNV